MVPCWKLQIISERRLAEDDWYPAMKGKTGKNVQFFNGLRGKRCQNSSIKVLQIINRTVSETASHGSSTPFIG